MPLYDYGCDRCGIFSVRRSMAESATPAVCPHCAASAPRVMSAPFLNTMNGHNRKAHERNERSADCPAVMTRAEWELSRHRAGTATGHQRAAHGHDGKHDHGVATPGVKRLTGSTEYQRSSRPWMIGH